MIFDNWEFERPGPFWRAWIFLTHIHNPPDEPEDVPVRDKRGRKYWLHVWHGQTVTKFFLLRFGERLGYAELLIEANGEEHLLEISVAPPLQRLGLGTVLLRACIDDARQRKRASIHGEVVRRHLEENPKLLLWYQANGFTVTPVSKPRDNQPKETVADIRLSLSSKLTSKSG